MNATVKHSRAYDRAQLLSAAAPEAAPVRLLIVSDDDQRLTHWRAVLPERHWEVAGALASQGLSELRQRAYDLVVVDVAPPQLAAVLEPLRAAQLQVPVLVEASRLPADLSFAGVLPRYRAMPCAQPELIRLVKHSFALPAPPAPVRPLL